MPRTVKSSPYRWQHPSYKQCYCYNRNGIVYTCVYTNRRSTELNWQLSNKPEAMELLEIRRNQIIEQRQGKVEHTISSTLPIFFDMVVKKQSYTTQQNYISAFKYFLVEEGVLSEPENIKINIIKELSKLKNSMKESSINKYLNKISAYFNFCVDEGFCSRNPITSRIMLEVPKSEVLSFTIEEMQSIILYAENNNISIESIQYMRIAMLTGMRIGEIKKLTVSNVFKEYFIIKGKGDKDRNFPFFVAPELKEIFSSLVSKAKAKKRNELFTVSVAGVRKNFDKCKFAIFGENEKRTFHTIRKAVSTIWKEKNMPLEDRCTLLGHNIEMETKLYNKTPDVRQYQQRIGDFTHNLHK